MILVHIYIYNKQRLQILEALNVKNKRSNLNKINFETSANFLIFL